MQTPDRILLVDDEPKMHKLLRICLGQLGYEIESAANGTQALAMLRDGQFAVTTLDLMMPDMYGIDVLREIRQNHTATEVIVITAHGSMQTAIEALRLGAYDYVLKPFHPETIRSAVRGAMDKQQLSRKLAVISDLSQELTLAQHVNQVVQTVLDAAQRVLDFCDCGVWLIDQPRGELHRVDRANGSRLPALDVLPIEGQGLIATVARNGQLVHVSDTAQDSRYLAGATPHRSELTIPLMVKQRVIGVLNIENDQAEAFSPSSVQLATILAAQAAVAIENARLHQAERREIAERRLAMSELRRAKESAEAADQAKSEFLARMSHEIRTPLHAILGTTELALETHLTREQHEYLDLTHSSAESLLGVINDILDFSKIEAHRLELAEVDFDLRTVVERAISLLALRAHRKGLDLICRVPPGVPTPLIGDPGRLEQVLVNLVGNAVKFTEQGEVNLQVNMIGYDADTVQLYFEVSDTGIGIPADKQGAMFDAFNQVDGSASRRYGGTGLGLTIAKQLVELMGGKLEVRSEVRQGSRFFFTLRVKKQTALGAGVPTPSRPLDLHGEAVLIVDDNAAQRRVLRELLTQLNLTVAEANTLDSAAIIAEQEPTTQHYRLALFDAGLIQSDDLSQLDRLSVPRGQTVLMLNSDLPPDTVARYEAAGFSTHLVKPIKQHDLWDVVISMLGLVERQPQAAPRVVTRQLDGPRLNVLLADDNLAGQLIGRQTLQKMGHTVQVAGSGREVLQILDTHGPEHIDLVLMDIEMPEMDGLEAIRAIRQMESRNGQHLPILAMTAYAMKEDQARCLEAGADGYLSKPIGPDQLLGAIEKFWAASRPTRPVTIPVDLETALEMVAGDRDLLLESVQLFLEKDYPRHWQMLSEGLATNNATLIKRAAHGLKGALDSFGSRPARDIARQLEAIGRSGELAGAVAIAAELEEEIHRFAAFYRGLMA